MGRGETWQFAKSPRGGGAPVGYAFATGVYLERFDDEALLLVADRDRLLTVNAAAADLFALAIQAFGSRPFSPGEAGDWLAGQYALAARDCRAKARELLAFGLRHGLIRRAAAER